MIEAHEIKRTLTDIVIDPSHADRKETSEFKHSKERLKEDGHFKCYICGTTDRIEVHHLGEWMFAELIDFDKLKQFLEDFDPYGYSKLLKNKPIETVDDVRNCLCLCKSCHTGKGTGVHEITMPTWLIQKLAKAGEDPVPRGNESAEEVLKELETL